jgi:hypothetical protein
LFTSGTEDPRSHRYFLEILVDLMFQCTDEQYPERILQPLETRPFDYLRYNYIPREQLKRKLIDEIMKPIRGIPGRLKDCRPVLKPLKLYNHISILKDGYYIIYK